MTFTNCRTLTRVGFDDAEERPRHWTHSAIGNSMPPKALVATSPQTTSQAAELRGKPGSSNRKPQPQAWMNIRIGRSQFHLKRHDDPPATSDTRYASYRWRSLTLVGLVRRP